MYTVRIPGTSRALRYCQTDDQADYAVVTAFRAGIPAVQVESGGEIVFSMTLEQYQAHLRQHGIPPDPRYAPPNAHPGLKPEHYLVNQIRAGVARLGTNPPVEIQGKNKRAVYDILLGVVGGDAGKARETLDALRVYLK